MYNVHDMAAMWWIWQMVHQTHLFLLLSVKFNLDNWPSSAKSVWRLIHIHTFQLYLKLLESGRSFLFLLEPGLDMACNHPSGHLHLFLPTSTLSSPELWEQGPRVPSKLLRSSVLQLHMHICSLQCNAHSWKSKMCLKAVPFLTDQNCDARFSILSMVNSFYSMECSVTHKEPLRYLDFWYFLLSELLVSGLLVFLIIWTPGIWTLGISWTLQCRVPHQQPAPSATFSWRRARVVQSRANHSPHKIWCLFMCVIKQVG